ncbi:hypothetical protein [Flexithrix dorotheae]|uniref:hypothetical protein n=1 Tax=Flexithrix dorotheae TaxID=70993 RepID=UPI0005C62326|nr:hypothetical protein [Flexithrix dorotheae]
MKYCIQYKYTSDSAMDFHFIISFGGDVVFTRKERLTIWGKLKGNEPKTSVIKRENFSLNYGLKQVKWYDLETQKRVSIEEEIKLNQIKNEQIDKRLLSKAELLRVNGTSLVGKGETFPLQHLEICLDDYSLEI